MNHMIAKSLPLCLLLSSSLSSLADDKPHAKITGDEDGWRPLLEKDFVAVNSAEETWSFDDKNEVISCTGQPISVIRTDKEFTNFELVTEWMHEKPAGNSGIFLWTSKRSLDALKKPGLPNEGIEVQVLDPAFKEDYEKRSGKKSDWFTCHGDIFPVKKAKLEPFPPLSPDGVRSFPSKETTKPHGQWNHYYVRAINGEVRLWVNGVEVSGGKNASPSTGYICLESEGKPIKFRNLRIRELP
ncbi:MAG: DUF1080 domain-containing protein [Akkermansiaceae bacterium]